VVGPGVVPDHVDAVRRFAADTGLGVLNTYGVKGLFRWDDPAHLGTIGLQERDVELAGVLDADLVLGVGLDDRELGPGDLGPKAQVVDPADLPAWAQRLGRADEALAVYEPLGLEAAMTGRARAELGLWDETLRAWRARQWEQVEANLHQLRRMDPDCGLYRVYAGRLAEFRRNPPPAAWDGVTAFDEK